MTVLSEKIMQMLAPKIVLKHYTVQVAGRTGEREGSNKEPSNEVLSRHSVLELFIAFCSTCGVSVLCLFPNCFHYCSLCPLIPLCGAPVLLGELQSQVRSYCLCVGLHTFLHLLHFFVAAVLKLSGVSTWDSADAVKLRIPLVLMLPT